MKYIDSLRMHAHVEEITTPSPDGQWVGIKIKLDHKDNLQGECSLDIWTSDAKHYHVGQELCGVFASGPAGRDGCLCIDAEIEKVSDPFNKHKWVELSLKLIPRHDIRGGCRFRLWPENTTDCSVGDKIYCVFSPIVGSNT